MSSLGLCLTLYFLWDSVLNEIFNTVVCTGINLRRFRLLMMDSFVLWFSLGASLDEEELLSNLAQPRLANLVVLLG